MGTINDISKNVLGGLRNQYVKIVSNMQTAKNPDGTAKFTPQQIADRIQSRMEEDALAHGVTVEELKTAIKALKSSKKSGPKVTTLEKTYRLQMLLNLRNLWKQLNATTDPVLAELRKVVVEQAINYRQLTGKQSGDRSNWNIYLGAQVNSAGFSNYYGGWGDGSNELRDQLGVRLVPHANVELDPAKVDELVELVFSKTAHYLSGSPVPVPKSTGYEKQENVILQDMLNEPPAPEAETETEAQAETETEAPPTPPTPPAPPEDKKHRSTRR